MMKCTGFKTSVTSLLVGFSGARGRLFIQASIWQTIVWSSSNVSLTSDVTFLKCVFMPFTADSHKPQKWGALSGMKLHSMPLEEEKSAMMDLFSLSCKNKYRSMISRLAPTKLAP